MRTGNQPIWVTLAATGLVLMSWQIRKDTPTATQWISLRPGLMPADRMTVHLEGMGLTKACLMYADLTGRIFLPSTNSIWQEVDEFCGNRLSRWHILKRATTPSAGIKNHRDGLVTAAEVKESLEFYFKSQNLVPRPRGRKYLRMMRASGD